MAKHRFLNAPRDWWNWSKVEATTTLDTIYDVLVTVLFATSRFNALTQSCSFRLLRIFTCAR